MDRDADELRRCSIRQVIYPKFEVNERRTTRWTEKLALPAAPVQRLDRRRDTIGLFPRDPARPTFVLLVSFVVPTFPLAGCARNG